MNSFSQLLKKDHRGELFLTILIIIYLVMGSKTPQKLSDLVNTMLGKLVLLSVVIYLFLYKNSVLAVLVLVAAFDLMRRSSNNSMANLERIFMNPPCEDGKDMSQYPFTPYNQFPYTLEQEVVKKMAPIVQSGSVLTKASYKPFLESDHDASPINSSG